MKLTKMEHVLCALTVGVVGCATAVQTEVIAPPGTGNTVVIGGILYVGLLVCAVCYRIGQWAGTRDKEQQELDCAIVEQILISLGAEPCRWHCTGVNEDVRGEIGSVGVHIQFRWWPLGSYATVAYNLNTAYTTDSQTTTDEFTVPALRYSRLLSACRHYVDARAAERAQQAGEAARRLLGKLKGNT